MMEKNMQEKIDKYLLGKLSEKELADFEKELSEHPELAEDVRLQQESLEMIDLMGDEKIRAQIKKVHSKMTVPPKPKRNRLFLIVSSIAAVLALTLIWSLFIKTNPIFSPEKIYTTHFEPFPMNFAKRGANEKELVNASTLYSQKKYNKAIPIFENLSDKNIDTQIDLALGISYLELEEYNKAISTFEKLIITKDPLYEHHSYWYAALGYLKMNDVAKCKEYLSLAAKKNPSQYKSKVAQLLLDLP